MRNLTVKREKSFVACLITMRVFAEDREHGETVIDGTPCRRLGELKNGEEKTFPIEEDDIKIFVIADELSKSFCFDCYALPAGSEDVFLSGRNRFSLSAGNSFRFDNNDSAESRRKKSGHRGTAVMIISVIVGIAIGVAASTALFSGRESRKKDFSADGFGITLTEAFTEENVDGYLAAYSSKNIAVFVSKEEFSSFEGLQDCTAEDYAELTKESNDLDDAEVKSDGNLTYIEYKFTNADTNETYRYFPYIYKNDDAFWMVQFAVSDENAEQCRAQISEWAKSVKFG